MPRYPLLTWSKTISVGVNDGVRVIANGVAATLTIPAGTYWGYAVNGAGVVQADALAFAFRNALVTHPQVTACTVTYLDELPGNPRTKWDVNLAALVAGDGVDWLHAGTTVDPEWLGFIGSGLSAFTADPMPLKSDHNSAAYYSPNRDGVDDASNPTELSYGTRSPFVPSSHVRVSWGSVTRRTVRWPYVDAAYVLQRYADDVVFATVSGRLTSDPNNTLEAVLEAAGAVDPDFRLYTEDGVYASVSWDAPGDLSIDAHAIRTTVGRRRYDVTLTLVEA